MCQMLRAGWWKGSDKHLVPGTEALHGMLTPVPIFLFQVCAVWCYQSCWPPLWAPWLPFLTVPVLCSRWTFTPEFGTGHPRRSWCWLAGERSRASPLHRPWALHKHRPLPPKIPAPPGACLVELQWPPVAGAAVPPHALLLGKRTVLPKESTVCMKQPN